MRILPRSQDGFTIVELIMAIVIGAIFVVTVTNLTISNDHIGHRSRDVSVVNSFAENKVESLRSAGYLSLSNGTTDITSELPSELKPPRSASMVISNSTTSVKKVDLTISYNEIGRPQTYSYTTLVGELGVGQN